MVFAIIAFLAGIGLAVIESTFMNAVEFAGIRPDLAVLAVVVATSRMRFRKAVTLAFMLGLTRDFLSAGAIGMSAFTLTFMAYFLVIAETHLVTDNWVAQIFVVLLGSVVFETSFALLKLILQYEIGSASQILGMIMWTSVYTSLFAPVAFMLTGKPQFPSYMRLKMKYDGEYETLPKTKI
ncbi:MAG: rod shape-determining protein MreD [Candidatus Hydrogenedentota bacterium]|nr:MAG: rod shape-determining protein MreD [Candidatus Hydrogenedentota bacterium]